MSNQKPYASLSNAEVHDIVTEIDNLILSVANAQKEEQKNGQDYSQNLAKEIAYMECRNLILSKL